MNRLVLLLVVLCGCYRVSDKIEPQVSYAVQDKYLKSLPHPFPPLTEREKHEDWGKEYQIAMGFAHELDLYQAITAFKRAEFLVTEESAFRRQEIQYEVLLCYYLGKKYDDVYTFERSGLQNVDRSFPAYHDLLVILYESYLSKKQPEKAAHILQLMQENDPKTAEKLHLSSALQHADFPALKMHAKEHPQDAFLNPFLASYEQEKKSVGKAKAFNMVLPGAGYLYLGQKKSALTAVLLNGLFIAAAVHCFQHNHLAAGIIFTGFEAGWYFGGIYGAGEEAKYYNERLYEKKATPLMNQRGLFPVFMLQYGF